MHKLPSLSRCLHLLLCLCVINTVAQEPPRPLAPGSPVEREPARGQTHVYTIKLDARQVARVIAEQKGVDVVVSVIAPDGTALFEVDSPNGSAGEEAATIAAQQSGLYRVEVRALERDAATGRYAIRRDRFLTETEYTTERLAALGRLWGAVKYFHPHLAYKDIDWDGALVKAIPQVKAARTPNEYRQAVSGLLQVLNDPATDITPASVGGTNHATAPLPSATPTYYRVVDEYVVINAADWAKAMVNDNAVLATKQPQMLADIQKARGVVLDSRYHNVSTSEAPPFYLSFYLNNLLPRIVNGNIALGTERYRIHNGYAPQRGNTSGGYTSALVTQAPGALYGQAEVKKPLAVVVDEKTPNLIPLLSGLQASGAKVIQVGKSRNDSGARTHQMMLADGVRARVRSTEFIHPDGGSTFRADVQLPDASASDESVVSAAVGALSGAADKAASAQTSPPASPMRSTKDNPYPQMSFPAEEYRLLALFRFWNVINYHFPYKHQTDKPWATVLTDFIPRFLANKNQLDYEMTVAEMVARLQDTHGFVAPLNTLDAHLGLFAPPLSLRVAQGRLAIENLPDESAARAADLKVGDVIVGVDGEPIEQRLAYLLKFKSLSTTASAYRYVHPTALRGAKDSRAKLRVEGADGQVREVEMARTAPFRSVSFPRPRKTPVYEVLPNGYGYIDLARLPLAEAHKAMDAVMQTRGLIFDMRGYPNGTAWEVGPRLSEKKNFTVAQFRRPFQAATSLDDEDMEGSAPDYSFEQKMPSAKGAVYKGKVVVLINEDAISQSEHTCLFFEAATDVTFVGSPTNGANGDVTNLVLPGGIYVSFSGHDVRHADGRTLQRVGIQPHVKVEPTPRGIREGRDEVLEAAIEYLDSALKK